MNYIDQSVYLKLPQFAGSKVLKGYSKVHSNSSTMITSALTVAEKQLCHTVLEIIAAELEVEPQELYDDHIEFAELGLDRNLASFAVRKIKQKAGIQLSEGVFDDCPDVGLFKTHLLQEARRLATPAVSEPQAPTHKLGTTSNGDKTKPSAPLSVMIRGKRTSSIIANLFLLPDGSGSAMCYARIPPLSPTHNLWALNSPFLGRGRSIEGFTIQALAAIWTEEILSIQPPGRGPYALGGWSAGGYYAFEVARQLRARGLVVDRLVLIDSPSRTRFEAMPLPVVEYLSKHNLMGQGGQAKPAPAWLVDHFAATLEAVEAYVPDAIGPPPKSDNAACAGGGGGGGHTTLPAVFIIWAEDALLSPEEARRTGLDLNIRVSRFLLESRREEDYGPGGWESLFPPGTSMSVATMPGHHFNIVHPPHVSILPVVYPILVQFELTFLRTRWIGLGVCYVMLCSMIEKNRKIGGKQWTYWRSCETFAGAVARNVLFLFDLTSGFWLSRRISKRFFPKATIHISLDVVRRLK